MQIADMSKIHYNVGVVCMKLKYYKGATEAFTRAIQCDPYFAAAYFQRASVFYFNDNIEAALVDYQDAYQVSLILLQQLIR